MVSQQLELEQSITRTPITRAKLSYTEDAVILNDKKLTTESLSRLSSMIHIPGNFLQQCTPRLARDVITEFLGRSNRGISSISDKDGNILSFSWLDYYHIPLGRIVETFAKKHPFTVQKEKPGINQYTAFVTSPDAFNAPDGKSLHFGVAVRDSLDGSTPTKLTLCLYRPTCTNGSYINEGTWTLNRRTTTSAEDAIMQMADAAEALYAGRSLWERNIKELSEVHVSNPEVELSHVVNNLRLPPRMLDNIARAYQQEPNPTQWGLLNAITRAANDQDVDHRGSESLWNSASSMIINPHMPCRTCGRQN